MKTRIAYKFRIFPTKAQQTKIEATLRLCCELYNAALQERRDAVKMVGKSLNYYDQASQLPAIKEERTDLKEVHSHKLSNTCSPIAVEDLNIKGLASGMLAKSVNDAGWSLFLNLLSYKAENAGSKLVKLDPRYTSQTCPDCDTIAKKELSQRWHSCDCGSSMHRDVAAALVILSRGLVL